MRWTTLNYLILPLLIAVASAEWSWGGDSKPSADTQDKAALLEGETLTEQEGTTTQSNSTILDDIVDELVNRKQGRSLGGFDSFDEVYSDPTIKEALDGGDDPEARNLIKGRLCTLGLIQVSFYKILIVLQ